MLLPNILSAGEEGSISLSLPAATRLQIRLITGDGRPLPPVFSGWLPGGAHRIPFHTANLPPGWYAIRIEAEKGGGGYCGVLWSRVEKGSFNLIVGEEWRNPFYKSCCSLV